MAIGGTFSKNKVTAFFQVIAKSLIFLLVIFPNYALGLNSNFGVVAGYDDNVNLTYDAEGSAYTTIYLTISRQRLHKAMFGESLLYFDASYKKFSEFNDEIDVLVGGHYSCLPMDNPIVTEGFIEGGFFRDRENPDDEFNWGKTGIRLKYLLNDKIKVEYILALRGRRFLKPLEFITETTSGSGSGSGNGGVAIAETIVTKDQNDFLFSSEFHAQINLSSWLGLDLTPIFSRLYSSIDEDEFTEFGGAASIKLFPAKSWLVTVNTAHFKKEFILYEIREDRFSSSGLIISKMTDKFEVFAGIDYIENKSTLKTETYRQRVIQCGITYFF